MGKYQEWRHSSFRVFKSKRVYAAGEQLQLGGPGISDLTDMLVGGLYIVYCSTAINNHIGQGKLPKCKHGGSGHLKPR